MHGVQQTEIANEFTQYVNKPINTQKIENTITDLQGTGLYSSISYNLIDKDDKTGLLVRPRLKRLRAAVSECGNVSLVEQRERYPARARWQGDVFRLSGSRVGAARECVGRAGGRRQWGAL